MNFSQLHERLRIEAAHRIHRGLLTGSTLAVQTGLEASHISNFLRRKRKLSLGALDRVMAVLALTIDELVPPRLSSRSREPSAFAGDSPLHVPVVSSAAAIRSPIIHRAVTLERLPIPGGTLDGLKPHCVKARLMWQRFVAIRVTPEQAFPMSPVLASQSIVVLDRQYNSLVDYRPTQPKVFGVHVGDDALIFRYVSVDSRCVILRPHALEYPVEILDAGEGTPRSDMIVGRVCICISVL